MSSLSNQHKRLVGVGSPPLSLNADYSSSFPMGPTNHLASATAALRCRLRFGFLLRSSLESVSVLGDLSCLKGECHERALRFADFNSLRWRWSFNAFSATPLMSLNFFNGNEARIGSEDSGKRQLKTSTRDSSGGTPWTWTDNLISANVLVFAAQYLSKDKLTHWGSKRNSCISKGQFWRLVTSAFLHANIGHLLVNCYSLSSIGPACEKIWGPERYLTIYISSAIAGSTMSYWFNRNHSVGASGAICGLVGAYSAYLLRYRDVIQGSDDHLKEIGKVIGLNLIFGLTFPGIDNWAHLGGLIGGAAISCLVDPAWKLKSQH